MSGSLEEVGLGEGQDGLLQDLGHHIGHGRQHPLTFTP